MTFATPWALLLLLLLPVVGWRMVRPTSRGSACAVYPELNLLGPRRGGARAWLARALPWLRIPALACLVLALARPQVPAGYEQQGGPGIDIMLVLDISGSMQATDFGQRNRFEVARDVLRSFIQQAGAHRLGLVVFAGTAFTQCPLAADHDIVVELLDRVHIGMLEDGTAIGMALATAANRLQASKARSKVIILLTDGVNNRGAIDPPTAATAAAALGIKIHAVGVGQKEGGVITDPRTGRRFRALLDEAMLKKIAAATEGRYFLATDAGTLRSIYDQIDQMEKSAFVAKRERRYEERFMPFALLGLLLVAAQGILGATWLRKAP